MSGAMIITGGSRGIGAATARLAAERGYAVCVNYLGNEAAAAQVVADIEAGGGKALAVQGDTAREDDVLRLFDTATAQLGPLTALVNNAGIVGPRGPLAERSGEELERIVAVNVTGALLCAREAVRRMSTKRGGQGGGIVNLGSAGARLGQAGEFVTYAATKGAIQSLTIGLAREVGAEGIRVNAVVPGLIMTDIQAGRDIPALSKTIPLGRTGEAPEIAEAILWLLSDAAGYCAGALLEVTGGR
jgi:NAD(P)-dependent dehydrogenase (short-subunit alcohol dehydrogenase family)